MSTQEPQEETLRDSAGSRHALAWWAGRRLHVRRLHVRVLLTSSSTLGFPRCCHGFRGLTPCFSLPIFQAHPPTAQAWLTPNLHFCLGLAAEGRADPPTPGSWQRSYIGWGSRTLPRASKRIQSARAKVTLHHSPGMCSHFVCFILQVLLCDSNKPTAPHQDC